MVKKIWITEHDAELYTLTLESSGIELHNKVSVTEMEFPDRKDLSKKRHTVCIGLLNMDNLKALKAQIEIFLME